MSEAYLNQSRFGEALRLRPAWLRRLSSGLDHQQVLERIIAESGFTGRYAFMTAMSAGIAVLGLLLSSPAVVIGAMLISPLMSPILGLGFGLAIFDFSEIRRSMGALAIGTLLAIGFTAIIVLASPLKAPTAEILARTRPSLFDLLVALFAALAGSFAIIRGRGETIVGVAIATALMPPLAVVGYGLATWNVPVLVGAFALYVTNFVTIALAATVMARIYGFGHRLSERQSWIQTWVLVGVFIAMAIPLGLSLLGIAREAFTVAQVRNLLSEQFGAEARVTQLDVNFDARPIAIRSVVIAPQAQRLPQDQLDKAIQDRLGQAVNLQLDQILLAPGSTALDAQRTELAQAREAASNEQRQSDQIARLVAFAAGVAVNDVTLDRTHHRVEATARALDGASLATYWRLEQRIAAAIEGWTVVLHPPAQQLPVIEFADNEDTLTPAAISAVRLSAWAAKRWNMPALAVPGLPENRPERPLLNQRRAIGIADLLRDNGIVPVAADGGGQRFRLVAAIMPLVEAGP